jgi:hypothetical protein
VSDSLFSKSNVRSKERPVTTRRDRMRNVTKIFLLMVMGSASSSAAIYHADVVLPGTPTNVVDGGSFPLTVDFGQVFSSIDGVQLSGTFSGDLWDVGESWSVSGAGGQYNPSGSSRTSFVLNLNGTVPGPFWTGLIDGVESFSFGASGGSLDLNSLRVTVDGTVSSVPIPAAVWLFGSALLGLGALKRAKA